MLHLENQKGKEDMKTSKFQKDIGVTTVCINSLSIATKVCGQLTPNDTYFSDICFSSVKTAEEAMSAGVDYYGLVKTIYKGICLSILEHLVKDCLGGSYLVMTITPRVPGGRPLLVIRYKYNFRKILGFISTKGDGSTEAGDPYLSCVPDIFLIFLVYPLFILTY